MPGDKGAQLLNTSIKTQLLRVAQDLSTGFSELLWPVRCVGCDEPGELLCPQCKQKLGLIAQHNTCPNCGAPYGWLVCCACSNAWPELDGVVCATSYQGPAARIVTCLKDEHELLLVPLMASLLCVALEEALLWRSVCAQLEGSEATTNARAPNGWTQHFDACTFVPATPQAHARRGFDQMALVCHSFSRLAGIPEEPCLKRASKLDQRMLSREGRASNLAGSVQVTRDVSGLRLLLLDDVVTSGASMRTCARALKARGAAEVWGLGFARVW